MHLFSNMRLSDFEENILLHRLDHHFINFAEKVTRICISHLFLEGSILDILNFIGYATVVDSLSAIKKLIFEEKTSDKERTVRSIEQRFPKDMKRSDSYYFMHHLMEMMTAIPMKSDSY